MLVDDNLDLENCPALGPAEDSIDWRVMLKDPDGDSSGITLLVQEWMGELTAGPNLQT